MVADALIAARVTADVKQRFGTSAHGQGLTESALLKRLIVASLVATGTVPGRGPESVEPVADSARVSVRLRPDDLLLLRERARARQLPASTYVSFLVRAHLRAQTPLPTAELAALRATVAEVGALGRNINQIARTLSRGEPSATPNRADLHLILKALWKLRNHTKTLINTNVESWRSGHEKAPH
jgi:hypothetical protein